MICTADNPCEACRALNLAAIMRELHTRLRRPDAKIICYPEGLVITNEFTEGVQPNGVFSMALTVFRKRTAQHGEPPASWGGPSA